jgi:hypothetical protein
MENPADAPGVDEQVPMVVVSTEIPKEDTKMSSVRVGVKKTVKKKELRKESPAEKETFFVEKILQKALKDVRKVEPYSVQMFSAYYERHSATRVCSVPTVSDI